MEKIYTKELKIHRRNMKGFTNNYSKCGFWFPDEELTKNIKDTTCRNCLRQKTKRNEVRLQELKEED